MSDPYTRQRGRVEDYQRKLAQLEIELDGLRGGEAPIMASIEHGARVSSSESWSTSECSPQIMARVTGKHARVKESGIGSEHSSEQETMSDLQQAGKQNPIDEETNFSGSKFSQGSVHGGSSSVVGHGSVKLPNRRAAVQYLGSARIGASARTYNMLMHALASRGRLEVSSRCLAGVRLIAFWLNLEMFSNTPSSPTACESNASCLSLP